MKRSALQRRSTLARSGKSPSRGSGLRPNPDKVREFVDRHRGGGFREREPVAPEVRAEAFARSGNTCIRRCGYRGRYLHPHHFLAVQRFPHLLQCADNVGALCPRCHMNHHYSPHDQLRWDELPVVTIRLAVREGTHALEYLARHYPKEIQSV